MSSISYNVKVSIDSAIYEAYMAWLKAHITGDAQAGIRGMMEVSHEGRTIFPKVVILSCGPVGGAYLANIRYFAEDVDTIHTYIDHYAAAMRGDIPASFLGKTTFNRYIQSGDEELAVGTIHVEMEKLYESHAAEFQTIATFGA